MLAGAAGLEERRRARRASTRCSSTWRRYFGNALTVHNPNSSRFGKFVMLHFSQGSQLQGVSVKTYLLEETRCVVPGPNERSFHLFYEMLRGAGDAILQPRSDARTR